MALSREAKAQRLFERDRGLLGSIMASKLGLAMRWERAKQVEKNVYYDAVARGEYEIEFEEDNND